MKNEILNALNSRDDKTMSIEELVHVIHENPDTPVSSIILAQNELLDEKRISIFMRVFHGVKQNHLRLVG